MCKQKMTENEKNMQIANCRICLLSKSNCANCPLNWALKLIEIENEWYDDKIQTNIVEIPIVIEAWV